MLQQRGAPTGFEAINMLQQRGAPTGFEAINMLQQRGAPTGFEAINQNIRKINSLFSLHFLWLVSA